MKQSEGPKPIGEHLSEIPTNLEASNPSSTPESDSVKSSELIEWELKRPFPVNQVKGRQGPGGMTLHYIDARQLAARLDQVVGPDGWQTHYKEVCGQTCCELSINYAGNWITKSDGAGETNVEGEKGQFSDAFKRAGVQHGVARYLYRDGPPISPEQFDKIMERPE